MERIQKVVYKDSRHKHSGFSNFYFNPDELWLAFRMGAKFWYIPIYEVATNMNSRICATLPMFHAFIGCDMVSAFCGRGKRTAWNTWKVYPEVTKAFEELQLMQTEISEITIYANTETVCGVAL